MKQLHPKIDADIYWERQPNRFMNTFNIPSITFIDQDNKTHVYPDVHCDLCIKLSNASERYYFTDDPIIHTKILKNFDKYMINGKKINEEDLLRFKQINLNIEKLSNENIECETCKSINNLCELYYLSNDELEKQNIINKLIKLEINGYQLVKFKESNGESINLSDDINHYLYKAIINVDDYNLISKFDNNINESIFLESTRWCKKCGSRKPNIINC